MEAEPDDNEQLNRLKVFGKDRSKQCSPADIVSVIWDLCSVGSFVKCKPMGYYRCCMCNKDIDSKSSRLQCQHELHDECLRQAAIDVTNDTMDPMMLQTLACPLCKRLIKIQECERIVGKKLVSQKRDLCSTRLMEQMDREQRAARRKQIDEKELRCPLCEDSFRIEGLITFNCEKDTHRFCKECATGSILQVIKDGKYSEQDLACQICRTPIDEHIIRQCISREDYDKLMTLRHKNLKAEGLNIRNCNGYLYRNGNRLMEPPANPQKKQYETYQDELERRCSAIRAGLRPPEVVGDIQECPGIISYDPTHDDGFIDCLVCGLQTCIKGCESAHRGNTCENYQKWKEATQMSDQKADQIIRQMKMMRCPSCRNIVLKEVGCNHITCRCSHQFCYICGQNWVGHNAALCRPPP